MATCNKCGKLNYEGVEYCTACGSQLPVVSSYQEAEETPINSQDDYASEQETPNDEIAAPVTPDSSDKRKKIIILSAILVIVLLVLLFLFWPKGSISIEAGIRGKNNELLKIDSVLAGDTVFFVDQTKEVETRNWNFGDEMGTESADPIAFFVYEDVGEYTVVLTINEKYTDTLKVYVGKSIDTTDIPITSPGFTISGEMKVGSKLTFTDTTRGATISSWFFPNEVNPLKGKVVTYTFKKAGEYEISLKNEATTTNEIFKVIIKGIPPCTDCPGPIVPGCTPKDKSFIKGLLDPLVGVKEYKLQKQAVDKFLNPDGSTTINGNDPYDIIQADISMSSKSMKITVVGCEKNAQKGYNSIKLSIK
jgi:hypothetical protein